MTTANSTEANKALVLEGIKGVFIKRDATVVDRLFSPDYRQHNPQIPNGTAAIKGLLGNLSSDFKYEPGLVFGRPSLRRSRGLRSMVSPRSCEARRGTSIDFNACPRHLG
jgi:hypothetical protein